MNDTSPAKRYASGAVALHWLVLILIVAAYACILLRENYERGSDIREGLKSWHFMLGLSVLALTVIRGAMRAFVWKTPAITPEPPRALHLLSILAHVAIYAWLVAMPLAGWIILSAEGDPVPFWGLTLPPLTGVNEDLASTIKELHETGGTVGYFLLGAHAAAALFHHYILKDNTLVRMMPGRDR